MELRLSRVRRMRRTRFMTLSLAPWGYMYAEMYATYRTSDGEYCGHTLAKALLHEWADVNAPTGTLYAQLLTAGCTFGSVLKYSSSIPVRGGGAGRGSHGELTLRRRLKVPAHAARNCMCGGLFHRCRMHVVWLAAPSVSERSVASGDRLE